LGRRRGRKPEEGKFEKGFWEEDGAGKTAGSTRQDQSISITPLATYYRTSIARHFKPLSGHKNIRPLLFHVLQESILFT
jgi:hypothetical protein